MIPERDLATAFWVFVRNQALDLDLDVRTVPYELDQYESDRRFDATRVEDLLPCGTDTRHYPIDERTVSWVYATLQDALIGFLVHEVTSAHGNFPYTFDNWLRTVILVLADVQREPDALRVTTEDRVEDSKQFQKTEHIMTISDDWSCVSRETFDFILRKFLRCDAQAAG